MHQLFKLRDCDLFYPRPWIVEIYRLVVVARGSADRQGGTSHRATNLDTEVVVFVHLVGVRGIEGEGVEAPHLSDTALDVSVEVARRVQHQASCVRRDHLQSHLGRLHVLLRPGRLEVVVIIEWRDWIQPHVHVVQRDARFPQPGRQFRCLVETDVAAIHRPARTDPHHDFVAGDVSLIDGNRAQRAQRERIGLRTGLPMSRGSLTARRSAFHTVH